uniref:uncharacterized protein zf(c2h2)-69 isoform X3 n=1 Tax=Ciona intestinalis TaxID=7719 RepID=UPI000EF487D8|nr:uncharacterized protein zf(c2h2)-69 isoform X3 [Ciona intestinalis]|eukprot:XP_026691936.1 uncharacterized protein zf(c2h2)-69 isoform X3 [Ciona intestinalis]
MLAHQDINRLNLCKSCNLFFPTIHSLQVHLQNKHQTNKGAESSNETLNDQDSFMKLLSLNKPIKTVAQDVSVKVEAGKDSTMFRTSPMVAYLNVPSWLQTTMQDDWKYVYSRLDSEKNSTLNERSMQDSTGLCGIGVHTTTNNRKMYWCRLCNYASFEKSTIMRHQRTHTGLRPYSCTFCNLAFTTKANCERHVRKRHHHNIQPNTDVKELVYCDYELLRKARTGSLKEDQMSKIISPNTGRFFSFQCRICKSAFSSRSNGARHVMSKHGVVNRKGANEVIMCMKLNKTSAVKLNQQETNDEVVERKALNVQTNPSQSMGVTPKNPRFDKFEKPDKLKTQLHVNKKLIPLAKIQSFNNTVSHLYDKFDKQYKNMCEDLNLPDTEDINGSKSFIVRINNAIQALTKVFENCQASGKYQPTIYSNKPSPKIVSNHDQMMNGSNSFTQDDIAKDPDCDYAQLFADGKLNCVDDVGDNVLPAIQDTYSYSANFSKEFPAESSVKPVEQNMFNSSWETNDFTSVEDLVEFIQHPKVKPIGESLDNDEIMEIQGEKSLNFSDKQKSPQSSISSLKSGDGWTSMSDNAVQRRYLKEVLNEENSMTNDSVYEEALPTMVQTSNRLFRKGNRISKVENESKAMLVTNRTRKCPKCNKVFPWASSLRRHIMTHTGLKPFMCGQCSMQFTTRSNLLRHVYRRHGLAPTEKNNDYVITLSMSQQKKLAEECSNSNVTSKDLEHKVRPIVSKEDVVLPEKNKIAVDQVKTPEVKNEGVVYNKRYACGLCGVPFANRSNLVRHLQRLHETTKDHPNFKEMLLKLDTSRHSESELDSSISDIGGRKFDRKLGIDQNILKKKNRYLPNSPNTTDSKEFKCGICFIGFTKRNNAARHIQQQHSISKNGTNFCKLIIHSKPQTASSYEEDSDAKLQTSKSTAPDLTKDIRIEVKQVDEPKVVVKTESMEEEMKEVENETQKETLEKNNCSTEDDKTKPESPIEEKTSDVSKWSGRRRLTTRKHAIKKEVQEITSNATKKNCENELPKWKGRKRSASRKRLEGEASGEFTILMQKSTESHTKRKDSNSKLRKTE